MVSLVDTYTSTTTYFHNYQWPRFLYSVSFYSILAQTPTIMIMRSICTSYLILIIAGLIIIFGRSLVVH